MYNEQDTHATARYIVYRTVIPDDDDEEEEPGCVMAPMVNRAGTVICGSPPSYGQDSLTMLRTSCGTGVGEISSGSNESIKCLSCCGVSLGNDCSMVDAEVKIYMCTRATVRSVASRPEHVTPL